MARFIPTKCQLCGSYMVLTKPAIKQGDTKITARGQGPKCGQDHEFTLLINPDYEEKTDAQKPGRTRNHIG